MYDDLSLKLCDFAGSIIVGDNMEHYVEEEDRYRIMPGSPRSFKTDLFALGCLIYEIESGARPYDAVNAEEFARLYAGKSFPKLNGLRYHELVYES
jgi:serine/threonine protein kinase